MKFYHCNCYESNDEQLIPRIQISKYIRNMSKEYPYDKQLENEGKEYYKNICNDIRRSWNIEGIISVSYIREESIVVVYEFPVKADDTVFIPEVKWDDKIERYYIQT